MRDLLLLVTSALVSADHGPWNYYRQFSEQPQTSSEATVVGWGRAVVRIPRDHEPMAWWVPEGMTVTAAHPGCGGGVSVLAIDQGHEMVLYTSHGADLVERQRWHGDELGERALAGSESVTLVLDRSEGLVHQWRCDETHTTWALPEPTAVRAVGTKVNRRRLKDLFIESDFFAWSDGEALVWTEVGGTPRDRDFVFLHRVTGLGREGAHEITVGELGRRPSGSYLPMGPDGNTLFSRPRHTDRLEGDRWVEAIVEPGSELALWTKMGEVRQLETSDACFLIDFANRSHRRLSNVVAYQGSFLDGDLLLIQKLGGGEPGIAFDVAGRAEAHLVTSEPGLIERIPLDDEQTTQVEPCPQGTPRRFEEVMGTRRRSRGTARREQE